MGLFCFIPWKLGLHNVSGNLQSEIELLLLQCLQDAGVAVSMQEHIGVEDAVLYMLHRVHSHLDKPGGYVRIMFFDFSSAFKTIQPLILKEKLDVMGVDPSFVTWITDYLP